MPDTEKFNWTTRDEARAALADLLPTDEEVKEYAIWQDIRPDSPLLGNENRICALLKGENKNGSTTIIPYLIAERSFLASCSSCWSWGVKRLPNCPLENWENLSPGGVCDPFEEIEHDELREGIIRAKRRIETGIPQSGGKFGVVILDMHAAYGGGWQITDDFFKKLAIFREDTSDYKLNQAGYQVVRRHDDHAIILMEEEPNKYDQYILKKICALHAKVPLVIGLGAGDVYWWNQKEIFSEAINRLWSQMKNLPSGAIVRDGVEGAKLAGRIGAGTGLL